MSQTRFLSSIISILLAFLAGCQTLEKLDPLLIESLEKQKVGICRDGDGAFALIYNDKKNRFAVELDWVYQNQALTLEAYNPFGQTVAALEMKEGMLDVKTRLIALEERVSAEIDSDGYLIVDGYLTGLNYRELSCFFRFYWPQSWLDFALGIKRKKQQSFVVGETERASIKLDYDEKARKLGNCAKIRWSHYFGLVNQAVQICFEKTPGGVESLKMVFDDIDMQFIRRE